MRGPGVRVPLQAPLFTGFLRSPPRGAIPAPRRRSSAVEQRHGKAKAGSSILPVGTMSIMTGIPWLSCLEQPRDPRHAPTRSTRSGLHRTCPSRQGRALPRLRRRDRRHLPAAEWSRGLGFPSRPQGGRRYHIHRDPRRGGLHREERNLLGRRIPRAAPARDPDAHASVAQVVERRLCNPEVVSSRLTRGTRHHSREDQNR